MLNLIIFGAPGSGKGTQSLALAQHYGLEHISTGDLLRAEIKAQSELGKEVESLISNGQLVPDSMITALLRSKLNNTPTRKGLILDGFPRTVPQAEGLQELLDEQKVSGEKDITVVVDLKVDEKELIERLLNRGKVSGRSDDNLEAIEKRLAVYHSSTEPVIDYFKQKGCYLEVEAVGNIADITERIVMSIASFILK